MKKGLPMKWIVGGVVILVAGLAVSNLQFGDNVVYFYTPQEAFAKAADIDSKTIKVGGMVKAGTVVWKPEDLALNFVMTDMQGTDIEVSHKGTPPDMFKENSGVVVEGRIEADGKKMVSQRLMVKHSEEYKKPDAQHSVDKELLEKSIFKN
ncbi:MAG TPA: cytochrome c maturation protein CcmE [Oligoflexus sp.]|uniref:cytochrome c maturation protein CcmE n=1 Tax=Oligoflexus sp. TaxID=1971216 RepID=UPI002D7E746B|nr:cytochrome c maturation protein CcmE [Oligoflexus sp.]HET9240185.1 cytochrome c maturation protein CcmE [Oligoflexus sp.]